jgi:hypothetical protein
MEIKNLFMKQVVICWLLYFTATNISYAQNEVVDSTYWKFKLQSSFSFLDGNASRVLSMNKLNVDYYGKHFNIISEQFYVYGMAFHQKTENDFRSENFMDIAITKRVVPFVRVYFERNYLRRINFRYQPGAGVAYFFVKSKLNSFRVFSAIAYENTLFDVRDFENYDSSSSNRIESWNTVLGIVGNHILPKSNLSFNYRAYYQQALNLEEQYRFFIDANVAYKVNKYLALNTNVRYSFENIIPKGFKPFDLLMSYGISISNFSN